MKRIFCNDINEYNNKNFNKVLLVLFLISIVLIPFDSLPYMKGVLGELGVRGPVYTFIPIFIVIFIYFIYKKKIYFKWNLEKVLLVIFITWTAISASININTIIHNEFKERNGLEKLILQIMVLAFMVLIMYATEYIVSLNNISLKTIRKYILISFIFVSLYSFLEILQVYGILNVENILRKISYYIHYLNRGNLYGDRIRSITGEASFLGMYVAFAYPWVVSYILTEKRYTKKILYGIVVLYMLLLVYLTKSRVAYAVTMGEMVLILFGILLFDRKKLNKVLIVIITICSMLSINSFNTLNSYIMSIRQQQGSTDEVIDDGYNIDMSVGDVVQSLNSKTNHSNIARLGLQKSAINMGMDNPIIGIGLGQFGFYADQYIEEDARISFEIQRWTNPEEVDFWPPAFALIPRIVAEQGFVGAAIFIAFLLVTMIKFFVKYVKANENTMEILTMVSLIGVIVSTFNADTYGLPQLWILLGIIIYLSNKKEKNICYEERV
ncbi:O-antigen ligase family protein [Clostridium saudiense]|uniref:O-antigen ligase family protein n=1 Tax=Clostridium saudiense TaxID=1414720 RepID=UPI0018AB7013|nr:O-antigen ligase family protein [Clostridium saudiense]